MMMEELVERLAELQSDLEMKEEAAEADELVIEYSEKIAHLEKELKKFQQARAQELAYHAPAIDDIKINIEEIKKQIIDAWDGEKKTLRFEIGTLKFRTSQSLVIEKKGLVLEGLLAHTSAKDVAMNYITGFNKTAVKKFMGVLSLPMGTVWIDLKTTVKLEEES